MDSANSVGVFRISPLSGYSKYTFRSGTRISLKFLFDHDISLVSYTVSLVSEVPPSNPTVFIGRHVYHSSGGAFFFPPLSHTHTVQRRNVFLSKVRNFSPLCLCFVWKFFNFELQSLLIWAMVPSPSLNWWFMVRKKMAC